MTSSDGDSWIARLRLPELPSIFGTHNTLDVRGCMDIEIVTMNYLRKDNADRLCAGTSICTDELVSMRASTPVPEVFGHDLDAENATGAAPAQSSWAKRWGCLALRSRTGTFVSRWSPSKSSSLA